MYCMLSLAEWFFFLHQWRPFESVTSEMDHRLLANIPPPLPLPGESYSIQLKYPGIHNYCVWIKSLKFLEKENRSIFLRWLHFTETVSKHLSILSWILLILICDLLQQKTRNKSHGAILRYRELKFQREKIIWRSNMRFWCFCNLGKLYLL